jgi:sec-independent protein translocase protein TatA
VPGFIGPWEIVLLVLVLVAVFGMKRLPELGRSLGKGAREAAREARELRQAMSPADEPKATLAVDAAAEKEQSGLPPPTTKSALRSLLD